MTNKNVLAEPDEGRVLRVAAYIRVSSENENQEDSYETQRMYFETLLTQYPNWLSAGVYSDYGISGTGREKRTGFNRLMRHCEEGRIDRIVTKSISRFSRNTRDFLKALQLLKEHHITIAFEKEKMDTAIAQNDMMITAFGAVAQEESRSISANIQWGIEKRRKRGDAPNICIYGYRYAEGDTDREVYETTGTGYRMKRIVILEEEAQVVRRIFKEVAEGRKYTDIARGLNWDGISVPESSFSRKRAQMEKTPAGWLNAGLDEGWTGRHIAQMIQLERYAGDVRMAKTYTSDYKTHKTIVNKGERDQYYVRDHHPAIVDRELFTEVQKVIRINRARVQNRDGAKKHYPFSGRLVCKHCGRFFRTRNRNSNPIWACGSTMVLTGKRVCSAEKIYEAQIVRMCRRAVVDRYGFVGGPVDREIEKLLATGLYTQAGVCFTSKSNGLVRNVLNMLERVQLADSIEHDRSLLRGQIARLLDEADRARHMQEALRAGIEVAEMRRDVLHEHVDDAELNGIWEKMDENQKLLADSEAQVEDLRKQLDSMERYWTGLEADYEWRRKAIEWMKSLPDGQEGVQRFLDGLTDEYVKAFILCIEVESPLKYRVRWFDDTWTEVEMPSNIEQGG